VSEGEDWRIEQSGAVPVVRSAALASVAGLAHGFSTRRGGAGEDFDLGSADAPDPSVASRRRSFLASLGLRGEAVVLRQVHGADVVRATETGKGEPLLADAVIALRDDPARLAPAVRTADCVPILIADRGGGAVAAVHAGWRGTAAGVARSAVEALRRLGLEPEQLRVALGPAIGPCCYEVGPEVLRAVARSTGEPERAVSRTGRPGKAHLDLRRANALQLCRTGVPAAAIHSAPWCTACAGGLFFSYRREGAKAGRMMACIGWITPRGPRLDALGGVVHNLSVFRQ
jgi:YfiH family protein